MVLIKPGVWHDTVWPDRTWPEDLWLEYGAAAPPTPSTRGGGYYVPPYRRPKRPHFLRDNRETLKTFVGFLRWKLGYTEKLPDVED